MDNSFYYFFSSTPQVLGGILALFGVFIIFKLQSLKTELLAISKSIYDKGWYLNQTFNNLKINKEGSNNSLLTRIKELYESNNIDQLKEKLSIMEANDNYDSARTKYFLIYDNYRSLIKLTIIWSIFTSITIIICLGSIPFGCYILQHNTLKHISFYTIILFIIICFIGFIYILIKALKIDKG
jgi:hypothetical protein